MEMLDVVDENGVPTGEVVDRASAHSLGIRHRTSHVWILRKRKGKVQVLLQRRSRGKDSFPDCYDTSSAGHIPAGGDFIFSALRELEEELGVKAEAQELELCGQRKFHFEHEFYGKAFLDNQVSNIYILWLDKEEQEFKLQKEELSEVLWIDLDDCMVKVKKNQIRHCIFIEELEMVKKRSEEIGK